MRQFWTVVVLGSALVTSTPLAAHAASFTFSGALSGAEEAPTPNNSLSTGSFLATLTGEPEQWTFNYEVSFQNLSGFLRNGHIHFGDRAVSGPVVQPLDGLSTLVAANVTSGTFVGDWTSAELPATTTPATVFDRLLDGQYYFNIHSAAFPGGETRGQIENPIQSAAAVPEPTTALGLLVAGAIGAAARRKKANQVT